VKFESEVNETSMWWFYWCNMQVPYSFTGAVCRCHTALLVQYAGAIQLYWCNMQVPYIFTGATCRCHTSLLLKNLYKYSKYLKTTYALK